MPQPLLLEIDLLPLYNGTAPYQGRQDRSLAVGIQLMRNVTNDTKKILDAIAALDKRLGGIEKTLVELGLVDTLNPEVKVTPSK